MTGFEACQLACREFGRFEGRVLRKFKLKFDSHLL
jgi:hypothetical protein